MKIRESTCDKREREINKKLAQYETAKTSISCLEDRVRELTDEARILRVRLESINTEPRPAHDITG